MHHSRTTRCKYIAIGANVLVIVFSLLILASLYLFAVQDDNRANTDAGESRSAASGNKVHTKAHNKPSTNSNNKAKHLKAVNGEHGANNSDSDPDKHNNAVEGQVSDRPQQSASLPAPLAHFINWLGRSVTSDGGDEPSSPTAATITTTTTTTTSTTSPSSVFTAGRPLIVAAFLSYVLAIVGSIAVGLEHLTLLVILIVIFAFVFACSLSALVFSLLTAALTDGVVFDHWNSLLIAIIVVCGLQIYTTSYLVYEIFLERRVERSHEYSLAKMMPNIEDL